VDAGDPAFASPPATDQRGFPRVAMGRIDIGAYEYGPLLSPVLNISRSPVALQLSWPDTFTGFGLQETDTLMPPPIQWVPSTNLVIQTNGRFRVVIEPLEDRKFFRLHKP
jgi:hypothetical protein